MEDTLGTQVRQVRRMKCTENCGGKLLQLVIKCKLPDKECCTLPELWAAHGAQDTGNWSCKELSNSHPSQQHCDCSWEQGASRRCSWFWFQLQRHTEMFFAARIVGIKKCLFHIFKSGHVVARCLLDCSTVRAQVLFQFLLLGPKSFAHCRQTLSHTHTQERLILFIYSSTRPPACWLCLGVYSSVCLSRSSCLHKLYLAAWLPGSLSRSSVYTQSAASIDNVALKALNRAQSVRTLRPSG